MNEKYIQALIVGGLIGGAILLNGYLNKPDLLQFMENILLRTTK